MNPIHRGIHHGVFRRRHFGWREPLGIDSGLVTFPGVTLVGQIDQRLTCINASLDARYSVSKVTSG